MGSTMSDWISLMRNPETSKLKKLADDFETVKQADLGRLRKSGLPIQRGYGLPYENFSRKNSELVSFLDSCKYGVVIRALPRPGQDMLRRYQIGVGGIGECIAFLEENIVPGGRYNVSLTEWEPDERGILIFSGTKGILAEIGEDVEKLSHGANPFSTYELDLTKVGHREDKETWKGGRDSKDEKILMQTLRAIELTRDNFNPLFRRGYFEATYTKSGKLFFIDYKVNRMYVEGKFKKGISQLG